MPADLLIYFSMAKETVITQENFDLLLVWLDPNREIAAQKYEKIRRRLIRVFTGRGCYEAEELADTTFNRITEKLPQIADGYTGEPTLYFYGVGDKIHLEWLRNQKKINSSDLPEADSRDQSAIETEYELLEHCLDKLPADQRRLIVEYYRKERIAKIENRRILAKDFGITTNALQVKASRIRAQLKECLRKNLAEKI